MSPVAIMFLSTTYTKYNFLPGTEFSSKVQLMAENTHSSVDFICYQHFSLGWLSHKTDRENKARKW